MKKSDYIIPNLIRINWETLDECKKDLFKEIKQELKRNEKK